MNDKIVIKGANQHNLRNVDLELPKNELIVFTGVSGSGKSSLAFDTIFAEGQRRYVESLSTYARQFLGQMDKPDVESIDGLSPAISIDQKSTSNNPRSTVGTVTEIYDYLRLLYARIGTPHCPKCGDVIKPQSIDEIVDKIMQLEEGTKIQVIAPVARGKKGEFASLINDLKQEGFIRLKIDGELYNLDDTDIEDIKLEKNKKHDIDVVVDRIVIKDSAKSRLADSAQIALKKANGLMTVDVIGDKELIFSEKLACPKCGLSFEELAPRTFSFNNPYGACPTCSGLGYDFVIDPDLVVPDRKKSIKQGAIYPWSKTTTSYYTDILQSVSDHYGIDLEKPFEELKKEEQDLILYGGKEVVNFRVKQFGTHRYTTQKMKFSGVIPFLEKRYNEAGGEYWREEIQKYMKMTPCKDCHGARLTPFALAVTVGGKNIFEVTNMPITESFKFFSDLFLELNDFQMKIAKQVLEEVRARLKFLLDVGLGYLNLSRLSLTLSGGEAQRIRLATQIGSGLVGVAYILDEPSIGLHQRDNDKLLNTLIRLKNLGNTLIVVEHDEDTMLAADHIVDVGPGAGIHGGEIVAEGTAKEIMANENSITGAYLSGRICIPTPKERRSPSGFITVKGAAENNLKNINVDFPLGVMTCVTGVSGSGKSSLVNEILYKNLARNLNRARCIPGKHKGITGLEQLDKVIAIDQSPIGRTPRSNPATYTGVFDLIRDLFAATPDAKARGYKKGRFSFNAKGGRCEACNGDGINKIEMNFLPDIYIPCEVCHGKRYNRETLDVKYKGKTIADVLDMTVEEAVHFFEPLPKIRRKIETLHDVGLSYIKLGQPSTTLSGGEAQRIKLATELSKRSTGKTIYILDEPTTGLHFADVHKLIDILHRLTEGGNTVVVIEHNLDVIKTADYIIDIGPEGGDRGGTIVATGTPEEITNCKESYTGIYIKKILKKDGERHEQ